MTITEAAIDITAPPAQFRSRFDVGPRLPWALLTVALVALALSLVPRRYPAPQPEPLPMPEIVTEHVGGLPDNVGVYRNTAGDIVAVASVVRPEDGEDVVCRILIDGVLAVEQHGWGTVALCVWIRPT